MSSSIQTELKLFDLQRALAGDTIAFGSGNVVSEYIYNFTDTKGIVEASRYRGETKNGKVYYFNKEGLCADDNTAHTLYIVEVAEVVNTKGENAGSVCDEEFCVNINITSLNPREQIAVQVMQAIIPTIDTPITMNASTIARLADKSFEIAQSMLSEAVKHRSAPTSDVDVDSSDVSSMTDKILYKIYKTLESTGEDTSQQ